MLFAHPHFAHCVCKLTVFAVLTHQAISPRSSFASVRLPFYPLTFHSVAACRSDDSYRCDKAHSLRNYPSSGNRCTRRTASSSSASTANRNYVN